MSNNRRFEGVWIEKEVWISKKLTLQEKCFFVEIKSLDNEDGCFATNEYFSEFFQISKRRCIDVINSLESKGFVSKTIKFKKGTKQVEKRVLRVSHKWKDYLLEYGEETCTTPMQQPAPPPCNNLHHPHEGTCTDNSTGSNPSNSTDKEKKKVAPKVAFPEPEKSEKKDPIKSETKSDKKNVAPSTNDFVEKEVLPEAVKEKSEIHLAMDLMNFRYNEWCDVRGIDLGEKIDFTAKECAQLKSLLRKIKSESKKKGIEYECGSELVNNGLDPLLRAYIKITSVYKASGDAWFTKSFLPSIMVSKFQQIREVYNLIKNGKSNQNGSNTTVTNEFKQRQYDILNRAKQQAAFTG